MYISKIELKNFKSFEGEKEINFQKGVNYIVGDNNVGKTTILQAINFLISVGKKENLVFKGKMGDEMSVSVVLSEVSDFEGSRKKYESYVDNEGKLFLKRSSKEESVEQGDAKKKVKFDIKTVQVWNPESNQYENPAGFSSAIKVLFDPQFIYADTHNEDYQDFGSTKMVGKLIKEVTKDFQKSSQFEELEKAHKEAFGIDGITKYLGPVEENIERIITKQFGASKVNFNFDFPNVTDLLKRGGISVTENEMTTDISEKGNGLQRALTLAIIQVYAEINNSGNQSSQYFIDEPEIYLHPVAQDKLIESFEKLTNNGNQVFITTHSPYVLRHYRINLDMIVILSIDSDSNQKEVSSVDQLLFSKTSIGEVTYRAFGVPTVDFHQLLFTKLYLNWVENYCDNGKPTLSGFDKKYLVEKSNDCDIELKEYTPRYKGNWGSSEIRTLPYIVRNEIDHPEVLEEDKNLWSENNLKSSIELLVDIYKKEFCSSKNTEKVSM